MPDPRYVRHKKRGTVYRVLGRGRLQTEGILRDDAPVTIYQGEDGALWARYAPEFEDGRFEEAAATTTPSARAAEAVSEALAKHLHEEHDYEDNMRPGFTWPEHENDDGYRGGGAYVRLVPADVLAKRREDAARILRFLRVAAASPATDAAEEVGRLKAENARFRRALNQLASERYGCSGLSYLQMNDAVNEIARAALAAPKPVKSSNQEKLP